MKKGQILEGVIKKVRFPNEGIMEIPGEERRVIVKNTVQEIGRASCRERV